VRAVVTGATGFLGGRLARRLAADGWDVVGTGRSASAGAALAADGVAFRAADLGDAAAIRALCAGADVVFHAGALSAPWGRREDFERSNVVGSRHVRAACRAEGVRRLIYVSSPSVAFDLRSRRGGREDDPLPTRYINDYVATKRRVEVETAADAAAGLPVVTVRPRAIFGPGDTTILPRLIDANATIGVPLIRGGRALVDVTYVDNVVDALLACASAPSAVHGRVYNVTNGEPVALVDLLRALFDKLGVPFRPRPIPWGVARALGRASELRARLLGVEPRLTRYTVAVLACDQTLDLAAAQRDLGYAPAVSVDEGLDRFVRWWEAARATAQ
jgi:2-alkyl-3-oxoalkanoate reductase